MKKSKMSLTFCKGDLVVFFFVVMLAIGISIGFGKSIGNQKGNMAVIYQEGTKIRELPLVNDAEILIENTYANKVVVKEQKVAITESDCPGSDCVHSGWISEKGRSIVCLPNRIEIRIEGETEVDFIVR